MLCPPRAPVLLPYHSPKNADIGGTGNGGRLAFRVQDKIHAGAGAVEFSTAVPADVGIKLRLLCVLVAIRP